ncbi:DNA primase [Chloroflexota bacterium]
MSVIDEVKQQVDIVEVVSQYTSLKKAGRNLTALCPFHSEKAPSFFVYPEQQSWHCFGACNTGGDAFSFVMKKENIDFGEALRLLAQRAGIVIPSRLEPDPAKEEKERLYQVNEAAALYFHNLLLDSPEGKKAREYLDGRGLSQKAISDFLLGFSLNSWEALKQYLLEKDYSESEILEAGLLVETEGSKTHDRFRNRLVFPINDGRGRTIGFGARVLDDSLPKYVNSPQTPLFDKSGIIYGLHLATQAIRQQELAVLVEGYMDVITAHQNGFHNVVAAMGTSITERQVGVLKRLSKNIALALDADSAGEEAMLRCVSYENTLEAEMKVIILPEGKDPDDVIRTDTGNWITLVTEAIPVVDYTMNLVSSRLDMTIASGQTLAVSRLGPIILEIKDPIRQAFYKQKLSRITDKDIRTIEIALGGMKPSPKTRQPKLKSSERTVPSLYSHPVEEACLALLLQHPELKDKDIGLSPEYYLNSENREIYIAWQQADNLPLLQERLDPTLRDYIDTLMNKKIIATQVEERYTDYVLRLRKDYLQGLARKRASVSETEGIPSQLPLEEDVEISNGLREVHIQKAGRGRKQKE